MSAAGEPTQIDFFVSYTNSDRRWAEWIAWQLEEAGYRVFIQAWDFRPGNNFIEEMHRATELSAKTLAVLSRAYLNSTFTQPEWQSRLREDPRGTARALLPVRVGECEPGGLLGPIVYVDLVDIDEAEARDRLLAGAQDKRARPSRPPAFPGSRAAVNVAPKPAFPPVDDRGVISPRTSPPPPAAHMRRGVGDALVARVRLRRPAAALAAAALLTVGIVVAVIVWPNGGVAAPAFTQVGVSPRSLAFGLGEEDRLWVADPTQPEAWWLDASKPRVRTGQVFLNATARPTGVAVDAVRKVAWVADERNDRAWMVDIPRRRAVRSVQVGDAPQAVAVADDVVWVANRDGTVSRIDAVTGGRSERDVRIGGRLTGIAAGKGAVWVIDTRSNVVYRIDAASPQRPAQDYTVQSPRSIAVGDGAAWVAGGDGTVSRIDAGGVTTIDVGEPLCGISVGEGRIWVSVSARDRVWRIDPSSGERTESVEVEDAPCAVAAGDGSVWVANRGDSSISRIEP
jgi:DNA-binding beta-propeller fold protein YncE